MNQLNFDFTDLKMDNLNRLVAACKSSVTLSINPHRDFHESISEFLSGPMSGNSEDVSPEVYQKMVDVDQLVELQFYPNSSISYSVSL